MHPPLATVLEDYYSDILNFHSEALAVFTQPSITQPRFLCLWLAQQTFSNSWQDGRSFFVLHGKRLRLILGRFCKALRDEENYSNLRRVLHPFTRSRSFGRRLPTCNRSRKLRQQSTIVKDIDFGWMRLKTNYRAPTTNLIRKSQQKIGVTADLACGSSVILLFNHG